jgi:hypothetical protein
MIPLLSATLALPLVASTAQAHRYEPPSSYVFVDNRTSARGELFVDGVRVRTLDPREDATLRLGYGEHRAQYVIGGHVAMSRELYVDGWKDKLVIDVPMARYGSLEIRSDDWRTMVVSIDNRMERQFEHVAQLEVSTGRHRVDVRSSNGRLVATQYVTVQPFDVTRVRIDAVPDQVSRWDRDDRYDDAQRNDRDDDRDNDSRHDGDSRR